MRELVLLGGGGQRDALAGAEQVLEQRAHFGERADLAEIALAQNLAAALLECLADRLALVGREEDGEELVAALADLAADLLEGEVVAELGEGVLPGAGMDVHAVHQRPVHVENHGLRHVGAPFGCGR